MLKRIGVSTAALFAMLTCIQPASLFADEHNDARYNSRYAGEHSEQNGRIERRDHDDRDRDDRDYDRGWRRDRDDRDRDRDWRRYRDQDDQYRYDFYRR